MTNKNHHRSKASQSSSDSGGCLVMLLLLPGLFALGKGIGFLYVAIAYGAFAALGIYIARKVKQRPTERSVAVIAARQCSEGHPQQSIRVTGRLIIHYCDTHGDETDRLVSIKEARGFTLASGAFLPERFNAYCHTRKANRTFLITHVVQAVDADTGEIVSNLQQWIRERVRT